MIYKIALCDDDTAFSRAFSAMLHEIMEPQAIPYTLDCFTHVNKLTAAMKTPEPFHLIFLDILLEDINGVDFARSMRKAGQNTDIIFLSVSPSFAADSYDVAPLHYLTKPFGREKLRQALNRALSHAIPQRIVFKTSNGILAAVLNDILYFDVYDRTISIHKTDGSKETFCGTLSKLESQLPPGHFMRSHKSYLVNMAYISEIVRYEITLQGGVRIPIGKKRYTDIQNSFIEYADQKSPVFL